MKTRLLLSIFLMLAFLVSCTSGLSDVAESTIIVNPMQTDEVPQINVENGEELSPQTMPILKEQAVSRCEQLVEAFNQKVIGNSGWIRIVTEVNLYDESTNAYLEPQISEHWYRLDSEGHIIEGYGWSGAGEGEVVQEYVFLNGWYDEVYYNNWFNLEYDFDEEGAIQRPHVAVDQPLTLIDPDFCSLMDGSEMAWLSAVEFGGQPAIQFAYVRTVAGLYDGDPLIESLYFDQENFQLLGLDTWWVQPNGNLKEVQSTIYPTIEFDATPPEARFAEIWARVPHGDTFVPLVEGE